VNPATTCSPSSPCLPFFQKNLPEIHQTTPPRITPRFKQTLQGQFPTSLSMQDYLRMSLQLLTPLGFCKANTLACVSVCRDEMTKPLVAAIQRTWNNVFSFSGLAGMLFMGKTGFLAAHHHAPHVDGQKRQVFFVFTHIGIGPDGEMGFCSRRESPILSPACGALMALQQEMALHGPITSFDPLDPEQSLIRQRLSNREHDRDTPDLVTLTRRAYLHIVKDLENLIAGLLQQDHTQYAVFSGIQIHGPAGKSYVWPGISYSVQHGQRHDFSFTYHHRRSGRLDAAHVT
jgi:Limiting CO2-inducible proteins B/C beta carbonyic anhydrases